MNRLKVRCTGAEVDVALPAGSVDSLVHDLSPGAVVSAGSDGKADPHAVVSLMIDHDGGWCVSVDGERRAHGPPGSLIRGERRLSSEVHLAIATHAPDDVFVHAGVVSWRGRAIVIPGRSTAGTTTLVSALLTLGANYLSDEYAVIDADGLVHPYARPLSIRGPDGPTRAAPESLGMVEHQPCPIGMVVVTHEPDATWSPARQRCAGVVLPLVDNAVAAQLSPCRVLDHLTAVTRTRPLMLTGSRGDPLDTACAILIDAELAATEAVPCG